MEKDEILKAKYGSKEKPLVIGNIEIPCYVLDNGNRVITQTGLVSGLGLNRFAQLDKVLAGKALNPYISSSIMNLAENPLSFSPHGGGKPAYGYEATILVDICDAVLTARKDGKLTAQQSHIAEQCEILVRGFAKVGIIALVDEATGYIKDKARDEYKEMFKVFISEHERPWEKEYPDEFTDMLYDLYGATKIKGKNHPQYFGKFINKYIYKPLAGSNGEILKLLDEKNPVVKSKDGKGYRKKRLHSFLSELGLKPFRAHLWQLIGIGKASTNIRAFESSFKKAFKYDDVAQLELELKD